MTLKRLDPLSAVLESVKIGITLLTTASLVRVIRAVTDAVAFGIHLVDALLVLTLEAEVRADTRGYSGVGTGPEIKTHRASLFQSKRSSIAEFNQKHSRQSVRLKSET